MGRRIRSFLPCLLGALLLTAPAFFAQDLVEEPPREFDDSVEDWASEDEVLNSPFHKRRFAEPPYAGRIQAGEIFSVASEMVTRFAGLDWGENEPVQQKIMNRLEWFLWVLRAALQAPGIDGVLDELDEQNIFLAALNEQDFGLHSLQMETMTDAAGTDVQGYFKGTPDEFLLYEWVESEEMYRLLLTPAQVRQWRLLQNSLRNLVQDQVLLVRKANVKDLKDAVTRWENFFDRGYSQMPWESLVNGWLIELPKLPELGPPDHQWILLHPTVGLELSVDPLDEMKVKEALHVEALGHVWYRGDDLDDYWGVSATISLREDLDPGIGAMVHIKRNWNLGIAWHDVNDDPFLFFSVDLFRFAKTKVPEYAEKYNNVRSRLGLD